MKCAFFELLTTVLVLVALAGSTVNAQPMRPAAQPASSAYAELLSMYRTKLPESIIRAEIEKRPALVLSIAQLGGLRQAGASEETIQLLYTKSSAPARPSVTVVPAQPVEPRAVPAYDGPLPLFKPAAARTPRVALQAFDYSTVTSVVQELFGTNLDIGQGIRSMLTQRITEDGSIVAIETVRQQSLDDVTDRNQSIRTRPGTGGRANRLNGADLMLAGNILAFGPDDQRSRIRIPIRGIGFGRFVTTSPPCGQESLGCEAITQSRRLLAGEDEIHVAKENIG